MTPLEIALMGRVAPRGAAFPISLFSAAEKGAIYDPSDLSTVFTDTAGTTAAAVGDRVARMNDKSGNGFHVTQGTSAARPFLRQDGGGKYYLEFDGSDDYLQYSSAVAIPLIARITAVAYDKPTNTNFGGILSIYPSSGNDQASSSGYVFQSGSAATDLTSEGNSNYSLLRTGNPSGPLIALEDKVAGTGRLRINGAQVLTDSSFTEFSATSSGGILIGGRWLTGAVSASFHANVRLYGAIILGRAAAGTDIADTEAWLAGKAGVTL